MNAKEKFEKYNADLYQLLLAMAKEKYNFERDLGTTVAEREELQPIMDDDIPERYDEKIQKLLGKLNKLNIRNGKSNSEIYQDRMDLALHAAANVYSERGFGRLGVFLCEEEDKSGDYAQNELPKKGSTIDKEAFNAFKEVMRVKKEEMFNYRTLEHYIKDREKDKRTYQGKFLSRIFGGFDKETKISAAEKLNAYDTTSLEKLRLTQKQMKALIQGNLKQVAADKLAKVKDKIEIIDRDEENRPDQH